MAKTSYSRAERVGPLIAEEIGRLLLQKIEDPALKGVTITKVKVTKDLQIAHVHFSLIGDDHMVENAATAFERARGLFKRALGDRLELRYLPELEFHHDKNIAHAETIDRILHQIKAGQDED